MDEDFVDPKAHALYIETLRRMTPEEKLERVFAYDRQARALRLAGLRFENPDASEDDLERLFVQERLLWNNPKY